MKKVIDLIGAAVLYPFWFLFQFGAIVWQWFLYRKL
jgi:hypothetical protein